MLSYLAKPFEVIGHAIYLTLQCSFHACYFCLQCCQHAYNGKPVRGGCGNGYQAQLQCWEQRKEMEREAPPPLPVKRKRSLTITDVPHARRSREQHTCTQSQSTLLGRLPLEIREMIFSFTLAGSDTILIYRRADRRLGHYTRDKRRYSKLPPGLCWGFDQTITGAWKVDRKTDRVHGDLLSLILTCRRAYVYISLIFIHMTPNISRALMESTGTLKQSI